MKPFLESLERRDCPAIVPTLAGGVLSVAGTDGWDWVTVRNVADQVEVFAFTFTDFSFGTFDFPRAAVQRLNIDLGGGANDHAENNSDVPGDLSTHADNPYIYSKA